jgi:hypothetical protein
MARNERLADAILHTGRTTEQVAEAVGHHPKTIERWISGAQTPYPRARQVLSRELEVPEALLFPELPHAAVTSDELVNLYSSRVEIPMSLIGALAKEASERIYICAYSATWLWDSVPGFVATLCERSRAGVEVRVCLGNPDSEPVRLRGVEEGIGAAMAGRCHLAMTYARPILDTPTASMRLMSTILYASTYRFDNDVLANFHLFGRPASASPVLHLQKRTETGLASRIMASAEAIWDQAEPVG